MFQNKTSLKKWLKCLHLFCHHLLSTAKESVSHKRVAPRCWPSLWRRRTQQENASGCFWQGWVRTESSEGTTPLASPSLRGFGTSNTALFMSQSFFQHPLVPTAALTRCYTGDTTPAPAQPPRPAELLRQLENYGCACPAAGASHTTACSCRILRSHRHVHFPSSKWDVNFCVPQRKQGNFPSINISPELKSADEYIAFVLFI